MEESPPPCSTTVTVRRNPPRRARPTPLPSISKFPTLLDATTTMDLDVIQQKRIHLPINSPNSDSLKVFLRLRPLPIFHSSKVLPRSLKSKHSTSCLTVNDSHSVTISPPCDTGRSKSEVYNGFSHVFSSDSSQDEVYDKLMRPIVEEFLNGKSGLLAAVGPSGSGKTHTVFGSAKDPGLVPRALRHIFHSAIGHESKLSRSFYLSMFEICSDRGKGEKLSDLSTGGTDICMQQSVVKGLKEVLVSDAVHAESLLAEAMMKRATAMTNTNSRSSRSQCIINIRCDLGEIDGEGDSKVNGAVLTFVDLAGAEREKKTRNEGGRLLESNFINNTSMVFGLCLRSLLEHQKNPKKQLQKHFQSSMLTRYLRDYLEGRKRMVLILAVRPGEEDYFDTSFLLRQASPYMEIKFHNVEETSSLVANKRRNQTISTGQQKRVKLSGNDACKDYVLKASVESNEVSKEETDCKGPPSGYQRDQIPEVLSSTVAKGNCSDAKVEREYLVMRGFAKALLNALKQYKNRVETAESEIGVLTENLRIEHGRYLAMEKELRDMKAQCSCPNNGSANIQVKIPNSEEARGCIGFKSTSLGGAGLQDPRSTDVSQVHHDPPPNPIDTKDFELISENSESNATLRKSSLETSSQQIYQVQASLSEYETSHDHVSGVGLHEDLANKDDGRPIEAASCLPQLDKNEMVKDESSRFDTNGKEDKENIPIGPGNISSSELENKQTSDRKPLNRRRPKRRLMPASSLLLRDVSGMEIADDTENVKKGKGGQRLVVEESKRSRGNASLLQMLKNRLPR